MRFFTSNIIVVFIILSVVWFSRNLYFTIFTPRVKNSLSLAWVVCVRARAWETVSERVSNCGGECSGPRGESFLF